MVDKGDRITEYDPFIIERVFPLAEHVLSYVPPQLDVVLSQCKFVLDANVLLAPFSLDKESLDAVAAVLRPLSKNGRLFVPQQAVREYARHRGQKIADHNVLIGNELSRLPSPSLQIPMYENVDEYTTAVKAAEGVKKAAKLYRDSLHALQTRIRKWNHNDPVTALYSRLFTKEMIIGHDVSAEDMLEDLERRSRHNIPPGYKGKSKKDGGIGDLAIWQSILKLGRTKKSSVCFVSNDGKPDWMVRDNKEGLFPRYELVDEFSRETEAHFVMLSFSEFLKFFGAKDNVVEAVRDASPDRSDRPAERSFEGWLEATIAMLHAIATWANTSAHKLHGETHRGFGDEVSTWLRTVHSLHRLAPLKASDFLRLVLSQITEQLERIAATESRSQRWDLRPVARTRLARIAALALEGCKYGNAIQQKSEPLSNAAEGGV